MRRTSVSHHRKQQLPSEDNHVLPSPTSPSTYNPYTPTGNTTARESRDVPGTKTKTTFEVGVTRPKRRLSRTMSASSSSPPGSPPLAAISTSNIESNSGSQNKGGSPTSRTPAARLALSQPGGPGSGTSTPYMRTPPIITQFNDSKSHPGFQPVTMMPAKDRDQSPPKLFGIELKWLSLITLALQNAFLTIIMHYSRILTPPNRTYSAAAAVLMNELLKGSISVLIALKRIDDSWTSSSQSNWPERDLMGAEKPASQPARAVRKGCSMFALSRLNALRRSVFSPDCYKLAVPAILYVIQNNLQYVAASNLDVATFQVTYQMKILTTAFFSVLMLRKRLNRSKWIALVLLAIGVGVVQLQTTSAPAHAAASAVESATASDKALRDISPDVTEDLPLSSDKPLLEDMAMHPFKGFMAVTLACLTSGLAGVYFELILKTGSGGNSDLWVRNTQLSLFSLIPALVPILFTGHNAGMSWVQNVASKFAHFNGWAIGTVLTQTFGGLITAIVIRYSDNIMKGFATSLSIIISFLASVVLFAYPITSTFIVGAAIVLLATWMYNQPGAPDAASRSTIAVAPGSPIPATAPILGEPTPVRTNSVKNLLGLMSRSNSRAGSRRPSANDLHPLASTSMSRSNSFSPANSVQNSSTNLVGLVSGSPPPKGLAKGTQ